MALPPLFTYGFVYFGHSQRLLWGPELVERIRGRAWQKGSMHRSRRVTSDFGVRGKRSAVGTGWEGGHLSGSTAGGTCGKANRGRGERCLVS